MSALDSKTLKDFAQAIIGETGSGSSLRYGTVRSDSSGTYVMLDGSSTYTPVLGNVDARTGDRVTIEFVNHQAVVTSNVSTPSSGYIAYEQPIRVYTEYAKNNSQTTPPTGGWSEILPEKEPNEYIWSRMVNAFANGTTTTDAPKMITGQNGKDGKDGKDALICGIKQPNCIFNGPPTGVPIGETCYAELYARSGTTAKNISVASSDITCPTGIAVSSITGNGSSSPVINFRTTEVITSNREAIIRMYVDGVVYTTLMSFGVALNGEDGDASYSITLTSSNGTVFTDRTDETTITASAKYGTTELSIDNSGNVYNGSVYIGRLKWTQTGKSGSSYLKSKTIPATDVLPYALISVEFNNAAGTTLYAKNEITLVFCANIKNTARYYQKVNTNDTPPSKPIFYPPLIPWSTTEPSISESEVSTKTIYYVEVVQYSDNSFVYSDVSEYTAFVSSKFALSRALAALTSANNAEEASEEAKQDAYDALIAATSYLKLDPDLQKIVISKLGTSTWKTFAIDSTGCSIGEYTPGVESSPSTYNSYMGFDIQGVHIKPRYKGAEQDTGGWINIDEDDIYKSDRKTNQWCMEVRSKWTDRLGFRRDYLNDTSYCDRRTIATHNEYVNIVSGPYTNGQSAKGSAYFSMAGGEKKTYATYSTQMTDYTSPTFAIGLQKGTMRWSNDTAVIANGDWNLANESSIGIIAKDQDDREWHSKNLFPNCHMVIYGVQRNTMREEWPSFWYLDAGGSDIAQRAYFPLSNNLSSSEIMKAPMFGFRGLTGLIFGDNVSSNPDLSYSFYVKSSSSTADTVVVATLPVAYPIPKSATLVVATCPSSIITGPGAVADRLSIKSASAVVSRNLSYISVTFTCNYNGSSKFEAERTFVGAILTELKINIT